jgi:ATP-dependent exoDNAse (exonuclease V) beta subunit
MATGVPHLVDEEERKLAADDLSLAYCVEAAAGTGKTTLLVERLLSIVREGKAELDDVAAITFTEKAAAELKVRLREKLEEQIRGDANAELRQRYSRALEQLDRTRISTIHAFAASLLRERPVEAGVDPGFVQLDQMGSQLLLDDVWQRWSQEQLVDLPPVLRRLFALEVPLDKMRALARKLLENRDIAMLPGPARPPNPINGIWGEITGEVRQLQALESACHDTSDIGFEQIQQLKSLVEQTGASDLDRERALLLDLKVNPRSGAKAKWAPGACDEQKEICRRIRNLLDSAPAQLGPSLAAEVLEWLKGFLQAVEWEKRERGVLDFQDLLLKARDLVRDRLDVRAYFQQSIRYLLVDEFQDTDPLQAELVFLLAEENAVATDWRQVTLAPDKLFLVGDPKQSIYRFRRADIQIYATAKRKLGELHQPLVIRQNFRSSPRLLRTINSLFQPQMEAGEYQAAYVPLEPAPERLNAGPGLALLFPSADSATSNMPEYLQTEAGLIAGFIRHICGSADGPVKIWDKKAGAARRPCFADIALLFPVTTGLAYYEEALRSRGVPFQIDAGRQFYARRETRDLMSVLGAIDDPENAIALVAALRSPFFGLSDADLLLYRHGGGTLHYLRKEAEDFPRMAQCLGQLRRWHQLRPEISLAALVDTVLNESCVLQFFLLLPGGDQAAANLLRVVELARRFENETGACLRSFVGWLEQRAESEPAEADASIGDEREDSVHLLTIHAAKGLEFPVVALAGMACSQRTGENMLVDHGSGQIELALKCGEHKLSSANFDQLLDQEQKRGQTEDLRLFYVAATRAKDCLIVPRLAPENNRSRRFLDFADPLSAYGDRPEQTIETDGVLLFRGEDLPASESSSAVFLRDVGALTPEGERVSSILAEREQWRAELEALGVGEAGIVPASRDGRGDVHASDGYGADAASTALGTAFHRIMSQVLSADDPSLAAIIESAAAGASLSARSALLQDWVTRTLGSPLLARARKAAQVWREIPFCIPYQGQIREGCIDLLFAEGERMILVDYKTDEVTAAQLPEAVEAHRVQLDLYREATKQLIGNYPAETLLFFVRLGMAEGV